MRARRVADFPFFDNAGLPMPFAHRGGALTADNVLLENSMRAFEVAVGLGYRHLETDVHASRDGRLVAFHDATLDRTTDGVGAVAALPYAEISRARIGGLEPIPLLSDILTAWPDVKVNIDAKSNQAIGPLARCIDEHRAWDRVCVAGFEQAWVDAARRGGGERLCTSMAKRDILALRARAWLRGALPWPPLRGDVAHVPVSAGPIRVVDASLLRTAHATGREVHVWTINTPERMRQLLDLGVDGILSDRPDLLRDVLRERGQWPT